ncbi:hypothetical protein [Microbispora sp. NPDC049633]|uniref:hypothetical protein n=1 Tax=Microbispora sp. NPDC049633 TaxID=3154355 RepID=UPI003441BEC8
MSRPPAAHGRTGRPPLTSRTQIVTAARRLIPARFAGSAQAFDLGASQLSVMSHHMLQAS